MASGRIKSPADVIERLDWISTGKSELEGAESLYRKAFVRYLNGRGIVRHARLPLDSLTDSEKNIAADDPLARALMFLMYATGTQLLPQNDGRIDMQFLERYSEWRPDAERGNPAINPDRWPDYISPPRGHTCFDGVDLPLIGVTTLLEQPIPDDDTASTDFDLYQYIAYRPTTRYAEFGGI
ncbi:hypothetical protein GGX14DRAFT_428153, partial [Mycena pura]